MLRKSLGFASLLSISMTAWAQVNNAVFLSVPTLDEVGLAALIALVGGAAGWAIRRRNRK